MEEEEAYAGMNTKGRWQGSMSSPASISHLLVLSAFHLCHDLGELERGGEKQRTEGGGKGGEKKARGEIR